MCTKALLTLLVAKSCRLKVTKAEVTKTCLALRTDKGYVWKKPKNFSQSLTLMISTAVANEKTGYSYVNQNRD